MENVLLIVGLALPGLTALVLQFLAVRSCLNRPTPSACGQPLPPISILKPLKGLDDELFDNLESFCRQDYPEYELLLALENPNDPAHRVARMVREKHPETPIRIVLQQGAPGFNPKINNLRAAYGEARHEIILISDSNVRARPEYLRETAAFLADPGVGLVTNPVRGTGARSLGARLENLHLNTFVAGGMCILFRFLRMPCVLGKSMMMRKADLEAIGGLTAFKDVLAEDYLIGRAMARAGRKVVLSTHVVETVNVYWNLKRFLNRHSRWGKLRWRLGGIRYLSELIGNAPFLAAVGWLATGGGQASLSAVALVWTAAAALQAATARRLGGASSLAGLLLAPWKDLLIGFLWLEPIANPRLDWRGHRYLIGKNTTLSPCAGTGGWLRRWTTRLLPA